jgi:hypothetical protein
VIPQLPARRSIIEERCHEPCAAKIGLTNREMPTSPDVPWTVSRASNPEVVADDSPQQ